MSLAYFEWSAPEDADPTTPAAWAQANPALGARISESFLESQLGSMRPDLFGREHLAWWSSTADERPISKDMWAAILGSKHFAPSKAVPPTFGIAAPPDLTSATIGAFVIGEDGRSRIRISDVGPDTEWVPATLLELRATYPGAVFALDPGSPAGSLVKKIEAAGIELKTPTMREYAQACGALHSMIRTGSVIQVGDPELDAAAMTARWRPLGDLRAWARKAGDVSALEAVTHAAWAAGAGNGPSVYETRGALIL